MALLSVLANSFVMLFLLVFLIMSFCKREKDSKLSIQTVFIALGGLFSFLGFMEGGFDDRQIFAWSFFVIALVFTVISVLMYFKVLGKGKK